MDTPLWTLSEIVSTTAGRLLGDGGEPNTTISGVSIDSRSIASGELFVAIEGPSQNGHDYVRKAFVAGAGAALVKTGFAATFKVLDDAAAGRHRLVEVPDTLKALEALGVAARARCAARIVAVTGSVGKTSTKEMMRLGFAAAGRLHAAEKSFNNHWGVPLTLARMPRDTEIAIFEIGMNHAGEIRPLVKMVRPHVAVITTVEAVHLGFFKNVNEIAEAKAEIFEGVEPGGRAILNADNGFFPSLAARAREHGLEVIGFGATPEADVRIENLQLEAGGSQFRLAFPDGRQIDVTLGTPGRHVVQNAAAVLAAGSAIAIAPELAAPALAAVLAPKGRGARTLLTPPAGSDRGAGDGDRPLLLIDESYNANPASMAAALANLATIPRDRHPRRIAVLGDMLELGEAAPILHRDLGPLIEAAGVDLVLTSGPLMQHLHESLPEHRRGAHGANSTALNDDLLATLQPGDAVMIKGSLGSRMGPLVEALLTTYRICSPH